MKSGLFKKISAVFLILTMVSVFSACGSNDSPAPAPDDENTVQDSPVEPSEDEDFEGEDEQGETWQIGKNSPEEMTAHLEGTFLSIEGSGEMMDFASPEERPWADAIADVEMVFFDDGITSIGDYAFMNAGTAAEEISFYVPGTLETIGTSAFEGANFSMYSSTDFSENLLTVGSRAFAGVESTFFNFFGKPEIAEDAFTDSNIEIYVPSGSGWDESNMLAYGGTPAYFFTYIVDIEEEYPSGSGGGPSYVPEGYVFEHDCVAYNPDEDNAVFDHWEVVSGNIDCDPENPLISFTPEENVEIKVVYVEK